MKILLTGGAGFIGSHLTNAYLKKGYEVVVLDNLSTGKRANLNPKAKFYHADITDPLVSQIFAVEKPDILNHHAGQISVRQSVENPQLDAKVNILGTINLLTFCTQYRVKKVIFASSGGAVYGENTKLPSKEDAPALPISPYGISKLCAEYYLNFFKRNFNLDFVSLRYGNVYGPKQDPYGEAGVVAIFSQKMLKGISPTINGNGKQTRDYVFVEDVASANLLATKISYCGSLNIGTGLETDVNTIFELLKITLATTNILPKHGPERPGEQKRSVLNIHLAEKVLKFRPRYNLRDGLKITVKWFGKNE